MKKGGGGGLLWLTRHPTKGVCPERPSGVKDLSWNPIRIPVLSERSESKDLSSHPTERCLSILSSVGTLDLVSWGELRVATKLIFLSLSDCKLTTED